MPKKQPQSRFERFAAGVQFMLLYQPGADMDIVPGHFLMGSTADEHISAGARKHLSDLGFFEDETNEMFAFPFDG